jgi:hypothetical protein
VSIKNKFATAVATAGLLAGLFGSAFVPAARAAAGDGFGSTPSTAILEVTEGGWYSSTGVANKAEVCFTASLDTDNAVAVFNFGGDKTATAGDLTIIYPTADASNAVIRLS